MNRFAPNRPGGGGVGFALQIYCSAEAECTLSEISIDYSREPIIRHFVEVFRKVVGYQGGFRIKIQDHQRKHVGLGSTGSVLRLQLTAGWRLLATSWPWSTATALLKERTSS